MQNYSLQNIIPGPIIIPVPHTQNEEKIIKKKFFSFSAIIRKPPVNFNAYFTLL